MVWDPRWRTILKFKAATVTMLARYFLRGRERERAGARSKGKARIEASGKARGIRPSIAGSRNEAILHGILLDDFRYPASNLSKRICPQRKVEHLYRSLSFPTWCLYHPFLPQPLAWQY